jgi:hypothetical protein
MEDNFKKALDSQVAIFNAAIESQAESDEKRAAANKILQEKFAKIEMELFEYAKAIKPLPSHIVTVPISKGFYFIVSIDQGLPMVQFIGCSSNCLTLQDDGTISGSLNDRLVMELVRDWPHLRDNLEKTILDNATHYATAAVEIAKQKSATAEEYAMVAGIEEDW